MAELHEMGRRERELFTAPPPPPTPLETVPARAARVVAEGLVGELAARRERLEANARDIREAALASEDDEGRWLWAVLDVENGEKSLDLLDAAAHVRQGIRLEQAAAKAWAEELQAQLEAARARLAGYDRQLAEIEERIVRPVCARLGQGDTKVIKTGLVRVAIHRTPARVEIVDPDVVPLLPDDCRRVKYEADRKAIKARLDAGETFPGIELRSSDRVDWK